MSTATPTGRLKLGAEPKKVIALGLFVVIAIVLWIRAFTSSGDSPAPTAAPLTVSPDATASTRNLPVVEPPSAGQTATHVRRRNQRNNDRGTLQMRPIDPTHGDIDPTLRLDLLERLSNVKMAGAGRSLFTMGVPPVAAAAAVPKGPTIVVAKKPDAPVVAVPTGPPPPPPIGLKFYGYIRPATPGAPKRGFFMDGDVILVASEGEVVKQHYRVVSLKEKSATFEDTASKAQQDVMLTPEARLEN